MIDIAKVVIKRIYTTHT